MAAAEVDNQHARSELYLVVSPGETIAVPLFLSNAIHSRMKIPFTSKTFSEIPHVLNHGSNISILKLAMEASWNELLSWSVLVLNCHDHTSSGNSLVKLSTYGGLIAD